MATNHPREAQIARGEAEGDLGLPRVILAKSPEGDLVNISRGEYCPNGPEGRSKSHEAKPSEIWSGPRGHLGNIPRVKYRPTHSPPLDPAEREGFMNNTPIWHQIVRKSRFEP